MIGRFWVLIIALLSLTACSLDINVLGKSTSPSASDSGNFPLGAKQYLFGSPSSYATLSNGDIVILEPTGSTVNVLSPQLKSKYKITGYGTADGLISQGRDIAVDSQDNIYVVDNGGSRLLKFKKDGTYLGKIGGVQSTTPASPTDFYNMYGVTIDKFDNIYVTNFSVLAGQEVAEIKKYDSSMQYQTSFGVWDNGMVCTGTAGCLRSLYSLVSDSSGNVYVYDSWAGAIHKFDISGNPVALIGVGDLTAYAGMSMTINSSDEIYVIENTPAKILRFTTSGIRLPDLSTAGTNPGQVERPLAVAFGKDGSIFVTDAPNSKPGKIVKFTSTLSYVETYQPGGSGDGQLSVVFGVASNDNFTVVDDLVNKRIALFDKDGNWVRNIGSGHFKQLGAVGIDASDNIYALDSDPATSPPNVTIEVYSSSGALLNSFDGTSSPNGRLQNVGLMAVSKTGDVFIVDGNNNKIQKFDKDGNYIDDFGVGAFSLPTAVAIGNNDNIFVADYVIGIMELSASDPAASITTFGPASAYNTGMTVTPSGDIYVGSALTNIITQYDGTSHSVVRTWGQYGQNKGEFSFITGMSTDSKGNIFVADGMNCRVQRFNSLGIPF